MFEALDGRAGGGSAISDTVVDADTLFAAVRAVVRYLIVIADMDCKILAQINASARGEHTAKSSGFNVTMTPEQESTKDRLGHNVQDTVEHRLGVGGDDVATLGKSPSNWVEEPEEGGPPADNNVGPRNIGSNGSCVLTAGPDESPRNPKESEASEDVVSPLEFTLATVPLQSAHCVIPCSWKRSRRQQDQ